MKKLIKILSYIFGFFFLLCALIMLLENNINGYVTCIMFLAIAFIILPSFEIFCKLINRKFSIIRKIILGIGTFIIPIIWLSDLKKATMSDLFISICLIIIYWIIIIATNKRKYIDNNSKRMLKESNKNDIFTKVYNKRIEKHNTGVKAIMDYENEIKNNFLNLDIFTLHAMANMVSETKNRYTTAFNNDMPEINISDLVMSFCKDTQRFEKEYELNDLYTPQYYINKINKECSELSNYIKLKIKNSLNNQYKNKNIDIYNNYIKIFTEKMETYVEIKFYRIVSNQSDELKKYKNYGINNVDYSYRDCFIYLIDLLATCTCIAKMIFIERKVEKLDDKNEFYKIINNMSNETLDNDTIIKKSRPIYEEFYKSDLGYLNNELHYSIAITIIVNKINNKQFSEKDKEILDIGKEQVNDISSFDIVMRKWINVVADKYRKLDIERYLLFKIINSINLKNFDLYFKSLEKINEYIKMYNFNVEHNNKASDKERYLKGDFDKEKKEISSKYSLNNITTGTQFELYLVNLFKELGYKVKHNGKSGDQGCDLIIKKDDYIYAIQAKYYTGKLSNTPVQEIAGSLKYYNANQGVVITNSSFTIGAEELAKANDVILIDGKDLKKLIDYTFENNKEIDVLKYFEK